jgi:antitoxin ParD1/3/4
MEISLTPKLEQFVKRQVNSGHYASEADVVLAAVQFLEEREMVYQGKFDELRREVMIGYEAAERGEVLDGEVVFENLWAKLNQRRNQSGE